MIKGDNNGFAGMNIYLRDHGYNQTKVVDETVIASENIENVRGNIWGIRDRVVLERAKKELLDVAKKPPFFMTIFTIDTHMPKGYLDDMCVANFGKDYRDVIACNDKVIASFLSWIKKQDFYKDTVVVLMGDHLAMGHLINKEYMHYYKGERDIFHMFMSEESAPQTPKEDKRVFAAIDIFPTILEAIGAEWSGKRLGLGVSLWRDNGQTLLEMMGKDQLNDQLLQYGE